MASRFIAVTEIQNGNPHIINLDHIILMVPAAGRPGTMLALVNRNNFYVNESFFTIMKHISTEIIPLDAEKTDDVMADVKEIEVPSQTDLEEFIVTDNEGGGSTQ